MSTRRLTKPAARERAAALALETEFRRWRREQGMEPTPGELFDLRVWALLVVWKGGGVMVTRAGVDYDLDPFEENEGDGLR